MIMLFALTACRPSKLEKAAYSKGCIHGMNALLADMGATPKEDKIVEFCNKESETLAGDAQ